MYMYLYILYNDGRMEEFLIKRFSDLSTRKWQFYYFEKPFDDPGRGTCIKRDEVSCIEVKSYRDMEYVQKLCKVR